MKEAREALARGDRATYDRNKKSLPFVIFIATYDESEKEVKKKDGTKEKKRGTWRNQKYCRLNGLCVIDFDHIDNVREIWDEAYARLSEEDKNRILFVFVTPSGHGLKVVFMADPAIGNLIDNQKVFSLKLGLNPDEACKDASRGAFLTTRDDMILLDERLFTFENKAFGEKYDEAYHQGKSQPTDSAHAGDSPSVLRELRTAGTVPMCSTVPPKKRLTARTIEELFIHLRHLIEGYDDALHPVGHTLAWILLQLLLPLLIGEARFVDGLDKFTVTQHGTASQIKIATDFHDDIDLISIAHSLEKNGLLRIIVSIGGVDICHEGHLFVCTLHVAPTHKILVFLTHQVKTDVLEGCSDILQLVIFFFGQFLACQFLLTDVQQELGFLADTFCGILYLLRQHVLLL